MNEKLQEALITIITKATENAGKATDFILDQTPEVIQQLLLWHGVKSFSLWVASLGLLIGAFFLVKKLWKWALKVGGEDPTDESYLAAGLCSIILLIIPLILFFSNFDWLQIWLAPKLYLIEYAAKLAK